MMHSILSIISGTPIWVWAVFLYLVFVGIKSTKERIVPISRLFIVPFVLILLRKKIMFENPSAYFCMLILGVVLGVVIMKRSGIVVVKNSHSVKLPGTYSTLLLFLSIFITKYFFGYINATEHELSANYSFLELYITALFSGYFLGRSFYCAYKMFFNGSLLK